MKKLLKNYKIIWASIKDLISSLISDLHSIDKIILANNGLVKYISYLYSNDENNMFLLFDDRIALDIIQVDKNIIKIVEM